MRRLAWKRNGGRVIVWASLVCLALCLMLAHLGLFAKQARLLDKYDCNYAVIDLRGGKYRVNPVLAVNNCESFNRLVGRLKPYAAICGTYYDDNRDPMGDIVIDGKVVHRGGQRQGVGFKSNGEMVFLERKGKSRLNWKGCVSGVACGPRLLRSGRKDINVTRDGFSEAANTNIAYRCAIGATDDGRLVLCAVADYITLDTLADIMLELGARNAVNMDGGSMCALYHNGKYLVTPASPMVNIIAVYKCRQQKGAGK